MKCGQILPIRTNDTFLREIYIFQTFAAVAIYLEIERW